VVLAGTTLTALVAYYLFPYGWSFYYCMMFGSILSATDPVAVSALLEKLGAPPRLKIHISGESLLNDGSGKEKTMKCNLVVGLCGPSHQLVILSSCALALHRIQCNSHCIFYDIFRAMVA